MINTDVNSRRCKLFYCVRMNGAYCCNDCINRNDCPNSCFNNPIKCKNARTNTEIRTIFATKGVGMFKRDYCIIPNKGAKNDN